ncbi:MAG: hypothetical protein GY938_03320 [Ketobacter sp.]|nr:hypothetical protein [Ketobacter sp.]
MNYLRARIISAEDNSQTFFRYRVEHAVWVLRLKTDNTCDSLFFYYMPANENVLSVDNLNALPANRAFVDNIKRHFRMNWHHDRQQDQKSNKSLHLIIQLRQVSQSQHVIDHCPVCYRLLFDNIYHSVRVFQPLNLTAYKPRLGIFGVLLAIRESHAFLFFHNWACKLRRL